MFRTLAQPKRVRFDIGKVMVVKIPSMSKVFNFVYYVYGTGNWNLLCKANGNQ